MTQIEFKKIDDAAKDAAESAVLELAQLQALAVGSGFATPVFG